MIPKASRKERCNMTGAASAETIVVYTVSSNRTFILTDLVFSHPDPGIGLEVYDSIVATATMTAATTKMRIYGNPVRLTDIQNGPEFERGVSVKTQDPSDDYPVLTYSCWIGGYER